jgi:hypothetical protein
LKKIIIKVGKKSARKITRELREQLQEVKHLRSLNNEHIVKYVDSWVEVEMKQVISDDFEEKNTYLDVDFESTFEEKKDYIEINNTQYK